MEIMQQSINSKQNQTMHVELITENYELLIPKTKNLLKL